uniref:Uncharacterized protein n=1 Tax=Arundo donax TaxID=35708 RepID=A0A0A9CXE8_ARUDO
MAAGPPQVHTTQDLPGLHHRRQYCTSCFHCHTWPLSLHNTCLRKASSLSSLLAIRQNKDQLEIQHHVLPRLAKQMCNQEANLEHH